VTVRTSPVRLSEIVTFVPATSCATRAN